MFSSTLLLVESDLAQGSRKAEPKARAGHADVLFWALIPDNRKGAGKRETKKDREAEWPVMELLTAEGSRGFISQIGSEAPWGTCFRTAQGTGCGLVCCPPFPRSG